MLQTLLGKIDQNSTKEKIENCKTDTVVTENEDCISQYFDNSKNPGRPKWTIVRSKPKFAGNN